MRPNEALVSGGRLTGTLPPATHQWSPPLLPFKKEEVNGAKEEVRGECRLLEWLLGATLAHHSPIIQSILSIPFFLSKFSDQEEEQQMPPDQVSGFGKVPQALGDLRLTLLALLSHEHSAGDWDSVQRHGIANCQASNLIVLHPRLRTVQVGEAFCITDNSTLIHNAENCVPLPSIERLTPFMHRLACDKRKKKQTLWSRGQQSYLGQCTMLLNGKDSEKEKTWHFLTLAGCSGFLSTVHANQFGNKNSKQPAHRSLVLKDGPGQNISDSRWDKEKIVRTRHALPNQAIDHLSRVGSRFGGRGHWSQGLVSILPAHVILAPKF